MLICHKCETTFDNKDDLYCVVTIDEQQVCGCPFCETDEHITENGQKIERIGWE